MNKEFLRREGNVGLGKEEDVEMGGCNGQNDNRNYRNNEVSPLKIPTKQAVALHVLL